MAIVVDPDNLDREQVIFGTKFQRLSLYPVGASVIADTSDGVTTAASSTFSSATGGFTGTEGDILLIKNGDDSGHYLIDTVTNDNTIELLDVEGNAVSFGSSETNLVFAVRVATGGTIADGVTHQAVYSFGKEEWRDDLINVAGDDLIKHEFPFEAITSESFEIGGTAQHADWNWFNRYTRKKVRTGGFAEKNTAATLLAEWTSVVTLGALDADTQAYYQQVNAQETPVNFDFLGPVNEVVQTFEDGGADNRTYLKLFARKKGRTYAQAELTDIGVTTIQPIVNRFPLAHTVDTAIIATDAEILGADPFRGQNTLVSGTDGTTADVDTVTGTFTSLGSTFQTAGLQTGDTIHITAGTDVGYFTIISVDSETQVTVDTEEFGGFAGAGSHTFDATTTRILAGTDGALADIDGDTGTLTSATGGFSAAVEINDLVFINDDTVTDHNGMYKVLSVDSDTVLTLDTSDKAFTVQTAIDFEIREPGMYLQYKKEAVVNAAPTDYSFDGTLRTITRSDGTWDTSIGPGSIIEISGAANPDNDGSYTVLTRDSATQITLIATDVIVTSANDATALIDVYEGFTRDIGGVVYAYNWRLTGNNAELSECYQFVQHQLRQTSDIDFGAGTFRGDVTDLLLEFATPTGTALNLFIDDLNSADINNSTFEDHSGVNRNFPFLAAGQIIFNDNLINDPNAKYWLFFTNDDAGDDLGRDYSTDQAIIVQDSVGTPIEGNITGQSSISFTYDYDGNVQRGNASAGQNAPVTLVCIGLDTAQFVVVTGTIARSTSNTISAVAALERNYLNQ